MQMHCANDGNIKFIIIDAKASKFYKYTFINIHKNIQF